MSLTLSPPELRELVGLAKTAKVTPLELQKRLCVQGIPFRVVRGRILVSRAVAEKWLAGADQPVTRGINLAAAAR